MASFPRNQMQQIAFIVMLLVLGGVLFFELTPFLTGFLGAITLYVLLRPQMQSLTDKHRWPKSLAATVLILEAFVLLLLPAGLLIDLLYSKIVGWELDTNQLRMGIQDISEKLQSISGFKAISEHAVSGLEKFFGTLFQGLINTTYGLAMNVLMMCFFLYFMLTNIRFLDTKLPTLLPMSAQNADFLMTESKKMVLSNAVGIPLIAVIQGLIASGAYYIFGVEDALFWGIITGFMSILPIVGTTIIWLPMSVYLFISAEPWQGIGLAVFSVVIITNADNFIRFILQKKMADVHPLVTVLGVIVGLSLFGFLGIIFGPLLLSTFILLFKIYRKEHAYNTEQAVALVRPEEGSMETKE